VLRSDFSFKRLDVTFQGGRLSRFGDEYAELSRADQLAQINWLLMVLPSLASWQQLVAGGWAVGTAEGILSAP